MSTVFAFNEISGVVASVPARYLDHPVLGKNLREVRTGKKRVRLSEIVRDEAPAESETEEAEVEEKSKAKPSKSKTKE